MRWAARERPLESRYRRLARRLARDEIAVADARATAAKIVAGAPLLAPVRRLERAAQAGCWRNPRFGWALAQVAHAAALAALDRDPPPRGAPAMAAGCALTLAAACNAAGRFAEALSVDLPGGFPLEPTLVARHRAESALARATLGQIEEAWAALQQAQARVAGRGAALEAQAVCRRVEGLLHLMQNRHPEAAAALREAASAFEAAGQAWAAAVARCELAEALRYIDPAAARKELGRARGAPGAEAAPLHLARCDHVLALVDEETNEYAESLRLLEHLRVVFEREHLRYHAARCALDAGVVHYRLNHDDAARRAYQEARAGFASLGLDSHVAICDLNIAIVFFNLGRYREAISIYERVAAEALAEERLLRAARCQTNMGLCYERLGRYDRALALHERAVRAFLDAGSPVYAAQCRQNLANCLRALGRFADALAVYRAARAIFTERELPAYAAHCDLQMADLALARGEAEEAREHLLAAIRYYRSAGMEVGEARALRRLAGVALTLGHLEPATDALDRARPVFVRRGMIVESALCDLVAGEIELARGRLARAEMLFRQARDVLTPGFPDDAWRVEEGLARVALGAGDRAAALAHYSNAAAFVTVARDALPTERLSSDFYGERRHVFHRAIGLAVEMGVVEQALRLVEASKARTLLARSGPLRLGEREREDLYVAGLLRREAALRPRLQALRRRLAAAEGHSAERPDPVPARGTPQEDLAELRALSREYDTLVEQLRLALPEASPAASPAPFAIAAFRAAAEAALGPGWVCLEYFLDGDRLLIFALDAGRLEVSIRSLTAEDLRALEQCASAHPERRELVYRGTLRGFAVPGNPGQRFRRRAGRLLLPEAVARGGWKTLVVVPHGLLHGIPFHALPVEAELPLLARGAVLYAPSLQVLQTLWAGRAAPSRPPRSLLVGLDSFSGAAAPLPHALREIDGIAVALRSEVETLRNGEATLAALRAMSEGGALERYDAIHFATHAVVDPVAPLLSHIVLADESLTAAEILGLRLSARLVTLAACQAAVGETQAGDETMTLARAFFHAGACAVVASLWRVEDESTAELMRLFYAALQQGDSPAQALRQAQLALARAGANPYQWAPFLAIGGV